MKKIIKYIIIGICILLIGTIYLFSSANTHQDALTEAQINSLCDYFASNVSPDKELKAEGTSQAAVKSFGRLEYADMDTMETFTLEKMNIDCHYKVKKQGAERYNYNFIERNTYG